MAYLAIDASGNVKIGMNGGTQETSVSLPEDISVVAGVRPCAVKYRKRTYVSGLFSPGIVLNEFQSLTALGIQAPQTVPVLTATTGTVTGKAVGHITFAEVRHNVTIHESSPSANTDTLTLSGQGRLWSGLPTTSINPRVNKIRGYVSMNGSLFRLAWERNLGVSTVTEDVQTLALGIESNPNRGVPPYCKFNESFHDRVWYAGDPVNPDRVWFSEIGEPESVGSKSFVKTKDGEAVMGVKKLRNELIVFCRKSTYAIRGFETGDFEIVKISPNIGCIAHFAIVNIDDRLWFPSEDGIYIYDGSFKFAMDLLKVYFRDSYIESSTTMSAFENAVAADDRYRKCYKMLVVQAQEPYSKYFCGFYDDFVPELEGSKSQPDWSFDIRGRRDSTLGNLLSDGNQRDQLYTGSCDGEIRKENDQTDADDAGDSYQKAMTIRTGLFMYNDPGGGKNHGKNLTDTDAYIVSENNAHTFKIYGGDEDAYLALNPMYSATIAATALSSGGHDYLAKSVHHHRPKTVSGRGFMFETTASAPLGMEYRGLGGLWKVGRTTRPRKT